jgi:hypothetical protein
MVEEQRARLQRQQEPRQHNSAVEWQLRRQLSNAIAAVEADSGALVPASRPRRLLQEHE